MQRKNHIYNHLKNLTPYISIIIIIINLYWFLAQTDKRISILENNLQSLTSTIASNQALQRDHDSKQDELTNNNNEEIQRHLDSLNQNIKEMYLILIEKKEKNNGQCC